MPLENLLPAAYIGHSQIQRGDRGSGPLENHKLYDTINLGYILGCQVVFFFKNV